MEDLKFYYDAVSQPSRAVWLLLEINKVPYKSNLVKIASGMYISMTINLITVGLII